MARCKLLDTLYWDLPRLFDEIKTALRKTAALAVGPRSMESVLTPGASILAWWGAVTSCWETLSTTVMRELSE